MMKISDHAIEHSNNVFMEMMNACLGVKGILLSSIDGHHINSVGIAEDSQGRLTVMATSLLGLGETIAKEARQINCKYVIVENSDGYVLTQRLGEFMVLTITADKSTNLGLLHNVSKSGAEKLSTLSAGKRE